MAEKTRRGGGGKLARSETVQVRLDPKLRMAAELAAAQERRTLSSFTEWAIGEAVKRIDVAHTKQGHPVSAAAVAELVWDVDEADRFVKLARRFPALLTHAEQRKWKFIDEHLIFWTPGDMMVDGVEMKGVDNLSPVPNLPLIRLAWDLIQEHIDEGQPFDWNRFEIRAGDSAIPVFYRRDHADPSLRGNANGP